MRVELTIGGSEIDEFIMQQELEDFADHLKSEYGCEVDYRKKRD
jgi:hypothetical protein